MSGPSANRRLATPRYRPAHEQAFGLDELDRKLTAHIKLSGGFFVEAGANDGVTQSNTLLLARYRGWRGLLIEPVPSLAERCRALRPESEVVQAALVAADYGSATVSMRYSNLMSLVKGARGGETQDVAHVKLGERLQGVQTYELEAPARTLSSILDAYGAPHVDLLCLDLEGYEPNALRGLDLERHRPSWVLVEVWESGVEELLAPCYRPVAEPSRRDVLFRLRPGRRQPRLNAK